MNNNLVIKKFNIERKKLFPINTSIKSKSNYLTTNMIHYKNTNKCNENKKT